MTTAPETKSFDILKWLATAEVRETPAPGTEPAQPGEYEDGDSDPNEPDNEEDQDYETDTS